ncbi:hypothetical protein [Bacillus sp. 166amftsu]|uniref:hypothetical protein n=1 Tax=Bacillus sp. 166amftsu TaxID=1761753 RepID=UPI00089A9608|nr:hypothetical protein [Bacillus sp. 166amftsu]SDZ44774.1 hypothetical protein SAMN04488156_1472 [Bacillus sp. 166amftsu]
MTICLINGLRNHGVDLDHLKKMNLEKPILCEKLELYYDHIPTEKKNMLVKISKIRGLTDTRLNTNCTWAQHMTGEAGVLALNRIETHYKYLQENGLAASIEYFQHPKHKINLSYLDKEDIYVVTDGNHRTVFAKMINAPYIFAEVEIYKHNYTSEAYYLHYKKLLKDLKESAEELNFHIQDRRIMYKDISLNTHEIPCYSSFNFNQEEMFWIKNRFRDIHEQLNFIEKRMRLFYFLNNKQKIRICSTLSHVRHVDHLKNAMNKDLLYSSLAQLYEGGYVYK